MRKILIHFSLLLSLSITVITTSAQGTRLYYTNRAIPGITEDSQGVNYLLLHKMYAGTLLADHHVFGKVTAIRGGAGSWNRKWTVEVNTASAYNANRGSIICYNESAALVTLTYNGENYLAVAIINSSSLYNFSFTGYAQNESLTVVYDNNVANVATFTSLDPITIQGNVGIGTTSTGIHKLAVEGSIGARKVKVNQTGWADFVFEPDYQLPSLQEVERFVRKHKHLPDIPSAKEVEDEGLDLGEMNRRLLQKIEEQMLYIIELNNRLKALENKDAT